MMSRIRAIGSILLILCAASEPSRAGSDVVPIADEANVYEDEAGNNGGADIETCVGNQGPLSNTRRAFVRYLPPPAPENTSVERVVLQVLQLRVRRQGVGSPKTATLQVRRVSADWSEGFGSGPDGGPCGGGSNVPGVDWTGQPATSAFSADAFLPSTDDTSIVIDTDDGSADDALIADVQSWVDNSATNFGWRLSVLEEGTTDNARSLLPGTLTIYWSDPDVLFADGFE